MRTAKPKCARANFADTLFLKLNVLSSQAELFHILIGEGLRTVCLILNFVLRGC